MNLKVAKRLLAPLAFAAIVFAATPASAAEAAKAPVAPQITLEELFAAPVASSTPSLANGQDHLFVPLVLGCADQWCFSTTHCRQICEENSVFCDTRIRRCILF